MEEADNIEITDIRLGISHLDVLNPIVSKNQNVQDISKLIYEGLLTLTNDYNLEYCLATEWSKAENKSYLIKLREGAKWHNGSDFTASDVKFTIDTIKNLGSDYVYYSNVKNIENVEVIGNNLVKIYLKEEEAFFEYNLIFPIICESLFQNENIMQTEKNNVPVGTGMYKIETLDLNSQLELKVNDNWWNSNQKKPRIEKVKIKIYSSVSEVYNAYKLGSIDVLDVSRNSNLEDTIGTIGYNKKESYGRNFDYLAFNCERKEVSEKYVRKAINLVIDRTDIVRTVYNGKYMPADYPLEYGSYLENKANSTYEVMNLSKAKLILEDSGWTYTNKAWQKKIDNSNVRLKLDLLVNSSNEARVNVANKIKEQLEEIGIQIKVVAVKDKTYESYVSNKNYDILLTGVTVGVSPSLERYFGEGNLANYENSEAQNILKELYSISDTKILQEKYIALQNIYKEDRPYIGLYFDKTTIIYGKNVAGTVSPNWYNYFYNVETWYRKS